MPEQTPLSNDTYTQVAPNSTGSKIRVLSVTTLDADGEESTVEQQVISIADENGRMLSLNQADVVSLLQDIRTEMRISNHMLRMGFEGSLGDIRQHDPAHLRTDPDFVND